jgi:hypothetical protein
MLLVHKLNCAAFSNNSYPCSPALSDSSYEPKYIGNYNINNELQQRINLTKDFVGAQVRMEWS